VAAVVAGGDVSAHRLDEYLQAARIAVEPDEIALDLDLTPGVAIVESLMPEIDSNRDGVIGVDEQQAYVRRVLDAIELSLDGRPLAVAAGQGTFPDVAALTRGEGTIRIRATIRLPRQQVGVHRVFFRNRYRSGVAVYLANALVPESARVSVSGQHHSAEQRDLAIDYEVRSSAAAWSWSWLFGAAALAIAAAIVWNERMWRALAGSRHHTSLLRGSMTR